MHKVLKPSSHALACSTTTRRRYSAGSKGLERFVAGQQLREVHQCVFGVLALESEAVDPRL